jgi:hypothetical protein
MNWRVKGTLNAALRFVISETNGYKWIRKAAAWIGKMKREKGSMELVTVSVDWIEHDFGGDFWICFGGCYHPSLSKNSIGNY